MSLLPLFRPISILENLLADTLGKAPRVEMLYLTSTVCGVATPRKPVPMRTLAGKCFVVSGSFCMFFEISHLANFLVEVRMKIIIPGARVTAQTLRV